MKSWKEQSLERKDFRAIKTDDAQPKPAPSKKDTKKWCKGKVGVEHTPKCVDYDSVKRTSFAKNWKILLCQACGKELKTYFPPIGSTDFVYPDWVK